VRGASFHGGVDEPLQVEFAALSTGLLTGRFGRHDGTAVDGDQDEKGED
jgi:hypothetical protein